MFGRVSSAHRHKLQESASNMRCQPVEKSGAMEMTLPCQALQVMRRYFARRTFGLQRQSIEMKTSSRYRIVTHMLVPPNTETLNAIRASHLRTLPYQQSQV